MKTAISNLSWDSPEDKKVAKLLKKYKITGVELAPTKIWEIPTEIADKEIKKYKKFWQDQGFTITSITSLLFGHPEMTIFENEKMRKKTLNYLSKMAHVAGVLGAKVMVFGSPKNRLTSGKHKKEVQKIAVDFFSKLSRVCQKYNTYFCLEPLGKTYSCNFITNVEEAIKLIKDINHPNFRSHIDIGSIEGNGEDYELALETAKPYMVHFHISEPGLKVIPAKLANHKLAAKILKKLNYDNWCCIEMPLANKVEHLYTIEKTLRFVTKTYG